MVQFQIEAQLRLILQPEKCKSQKYRREWQWWYRRNESQSYGMTHSLTLRKTKWPYLAVDSLALNDYYY